ncbi:hypothetical protein CRE_15195 [Caenorhabditis remanei]|uniref:DUF38 domain-containing protein n=1 Tax=Caenorhabditis remanei TaxID=31234 RepID=E3NR25_CAERE|nr:hypothetical protein CRE_15195 [Caenorhabditis remanei]
MSSEADKLAESLRNIAISCMPIEQRINLGEQDPSFRQEESQVPYQIQMVHIDYKPRRIEINIDKHSFVLRPQPESVKVVVSNNGLIQGFNMPSGMTLDDSLKKITDYFLGRPGTKINQLLISSEDVLEKCVVPELIHQRYICYDSRNLEKAVVIKCPESFVFASRFGVDMIRTVYQQFKTLNYTAGMALEIGTGGIESRIFPRAIEALQDLNPKLGVQPKHECYDLECTRPDVEYATHLQCLVFDVEGSDCELVVCLPDFVRIPVIFGGDISHVVRFKMIQKGTTAICSEENWLSVFDVDGFISFVNMAV